MNLVKCENCGTSNFASVEKCRKCGYESTPYYVAPTPGLWRDKKLLVKSLYASLGNNCVKCNKPIDTFPTPMTLNYDVHITFITFLLGGFDVRTIDLQVPLCIEFD